jgi:hypothetical protein
MKIALAKGHVTVICMTVSMGVLGMRREVVMVGNGQVREVVRVGIVGTSRMREVVRVGIVGMSQVRHYFLMSFFCSHMV